MNHQERCVLLSGCRTFNNYELFRDFTLHYCQKFNSYTIISDATKTYTSLINQFIGEYPHHVMSLPVDWGGVKKGDLSLNYFSSALARASTHAILFWDGCSDLKLMQHCNENLVDMRVVIYEPGIKASSLAFI